jgi:hypothetical protein
MGAFLQLFVAKVPEKKLVYSKLIEFLAGVVVTFCQYLDEILANLRDCDGALETW